MFANKQYGLRAWCVLPLTAYSSARVPADRRMVDGTPITLTSYFARKVRKGVRGRAGRGLLRGFVYRCRVQVRGASSIGIGLAPGIT